MIHIFNGHKPNIHKDAFVAPSADVIGRVTLAKGANVWYGAVLRGDIHEIRIGARTNVQDNCVLHVDRNLPCIVKNDVTIGHQATVHGCVIEPGALIGIGARILDGAVIGRYALIAAGAVVLEKTKIPPYSLAVGIPARVVRKLTAQEIAHLKQSAVNYVKLASSYSAFR